MNTIEEQDKLLNFQKRVRMAIKNGKTVDTNDKYILGVLDDLLCSETNVKPVRR